MVRSMPLIVLLCFAATSVLAQSNEDGRTDIKVDNGFSDKLGSRSGILLEFGVTNVHPRELNVMLLNYGGFTELQTIGFSSNQSDENKADKDHFGTDFTYSVHWFLPQENYGMTASGERMKYRMKGWELMTSTIGGRYAPNEHLDFIIGIGVFWGNLKLTSVNVTEGAGKMLYKNPFVAPMFRSEIRFNYSFLSLGGRFSYRYDITDDNWKRKDAGLDPLPGYKFQEIQYMAYIGFRFRE